MSEGKVEAMLALRREGRPLVGRDRIELLEAVATHGSITKAAKAVGLSYKAAWDALNAINNLLPRPAIQGQTGGKQGGGATVTEDGKALIAGFRLLEQRLARVAEALAGDASGTNDPLSLLWSLGMKTSARNAFRCTVTGREDGAVSTEFTLDIGEGKSLIAIITRDGAEELDLKEGDRAMALFKASHVILAVG